MRNGDLLKQLNTLKNIKPDESWKASNREILRKQVYATSSENRRRFAFLDWPRLLMQSITQPGLAVILILIFMAGSGFAGLRASKDTKPGDSLYIAKILGERTQLALTFDDKEKARLGIEFAGNRAKELNQVIAENNSDKNEQVDQLVDNFKKEISAVKTRLEKISGKSAGPAVNTAAGNDMPAEGASTTGENADTSVFSANLGKDDQGLSIAEPETAATEPAESETAVVEPEIASATPETASTTATTTPAAAVPAKAGTPEEILKQAEQLLNSDNFDNTVSKLDEAVSAIENVDTGEVKGESEGATTTESGATGAGATMEDGTVLGATATGTDPGDAGIATSTK